jgi:hypothetical protein
MPEIEVNSSDPEAEPVVVGSEASRISYRQSSEINKLIYSTGKKNLK